MTKYTPQGRPQNLQPPAPTRILLFLMVCFFASAGFRLAETAVTASSTMTWRSDVLAQGAQTENSTSFPKNTEEVQTDQTRTEGGSNDVANRLPLFSTDSCEPSELMNILKQQEQNITERTLRLDAREKALDIARSRIMERLEAMETAKADLEATITHVERAAQKDVQHLVDMYTSMKPKQAGEIFNTMQPDFAAGLVGQMKATVASAILANMDSEKAHAVSVVMAGRNANAPTQ